MTPEPCLPPLACPVCGRPLQRIENSLRCEAAHSFDFARDGYINLLPARRAPSATVGDAPEMLLARRQFLDSGHYAPLAQAIAGIVCGEAKGLMRPLRLLDAGCGDGYYLGAVQSALERESPSLPACCFGTDVAKAAVRLAAKRHRQALFVVADTTKSLPLLDSSIDVLLNIFAPRNPAEFVRVLAPGGMLLAVLPAPEHLLSLRLSLPLLGIEEKKAEHVEQLFVGGLQPAGRHDVCFDLYLDSAALRLLVTMMPGYRHLAPQDRQALENLPGMRTVAAFTIMQFRKEAVAET